MKSLNFQGTFLVLVCRSDGVYVRSSTCPEWSIGQSFNQWISEEGGQSFNQCDSLRETRFFSGTNEPFSFLSKGNFLGLINWSHNMTVLSKLLIRKRTGKVNVYHLSKDTSNELISLTLKMILSSYFSDLKCAKYYSIILDRTPDIYHSEKKKMSVIFRYIPFKLGESVKILESFFGFLTGDRKGSFEIFKKWY